MISVLNTVPGMLIDVATRRPRLGFGTGGVSGAALLPMGVLAVARVARAVPIPVIGLGGVSEADHALQYILAGAHLVGVGTAQLRDPRTAERIVGELAEWCARTGVGSLSDVRGTLEWSPK
jgi:dihydroorotate dehydrogenase (NAD+) catalytic subunit